MRSDGLGNGLDEFLERNRLSGPEPFDRLVQSIGDGPQPGERCATLATFEVDEVLAREMGLVGQSLRRPALVSSESADTRADGGPKGCGWRI